MYGDVVKVVRPRLKMNQSFKETRKTEFHGPLDQVVVRLFSFTHYGIEVEDGMVIHFVIRSIHTPNDCIIEKVPIATFLKDGFLEYEEGVHYAFPREEIVKRANSQVGDKFTGYRVHNNNCEHFAYWCATGERFANQSRLLMVYRYLSIAPKKTAYYGKKAGSGAKKATIKVWKLCISLLSGL